MITFSDLKVCLAYAQQLPSYSIGVYYFGYWSPEFAKSQLDHYRSHFSGRADWWAGVRDLFQSADGTGGALYKGDFKHLKPSIGWYDVSKKDTLEQQVRKAKQFGLRYFNFYSYWDAERAEPRYDDGLQSFLGAKNSQDMQFMIAVTAQQNLDPRIDIPRSDFESVAEVISKRYLSQPNYLQDGLGRKMLELLDTRGLGSGSAEDVISFINIIKSKAKRDGNGDLAILLNGTMALPADVSYFDAITCTDNFAFVRAGKYGRVTYEDYLRKVPEFFKELSAKANGRKPLLPCVSSGHDERPRLYLNTRANDPQSLAEVRRKLGFYSDRSPALFLQALAEAKAFVKTSGPFKGFLNVYAWNEWNEGGIVEPNVRDGEAYLNAIRNVYGSPTP